MEPSRFVAGDGDQLQDEGNKSGGVGVGRVLSKVSWCNVQTVIRKAVDYTR